MEIVLVRGDFVTGADIHSNDKSIISTQNSQNPISGYQVNNSFSI